MRYTSKAGKSFRFDLIFKKVVKNQVVKYTPVTGCTKEPVELCAPAGCGYKEDSFTPM